MKSKSTYIKKTGILFLSLFALISCSSDDDNGDGGAGKEQSDAKAITSFVFLATDNDVLTEDLEGTIDEEDKTITAEVPFGTDVDGLVPSITVSEKATVNPENKTATDFTDVVTYTVTAEDGSKEEYNVTISLGQSSAKRITSFTFLATDNDALTEDLESIIDEGDKTISAEVPFGTDVNGLVPTITVSENATVNPENKTATDFADTVTYTVTAEDGSEEEYSVTLTITPPTEREVLIALYNANPDNRLGWDLEDQDISNWEGVTVANGTVTRLELYDDEVLDSVPPSIGYLENLEVLDLSFNDIDTLPKEIGLLANLKYLFLSGNSLTTIPSEIGKLDKLQTLDLENNALNNLPGEIGDLSNLTDLFLEKNSLTALPAGLGNLTNLEFLDLQSNNLTTLPQEIGNLSNLVRIYLNRNNLESIPTQIGNLSNLEFLILYDNELDSIPAEIGNLSNLTHLYIYNNQITTIPLEVCDLNLSDFRKGDAVCEKF